MPNEYRDRLSLIAMIVDLIFKDGMLSDAENEFIDRLAVLYEIEPIDILKIKSKEFKPEITFPTNESDRIPFFQTCVMAMRLDENVTDEEMKYCNALGIKMGIRQESITLIMKLFEEFHPHPVPMDKLLSAYNIGKN